MYLLNHLKKEEGCILGITDDEYDKFYQSFREQIADIDTRISMLQKVEERRQLVKLILQNPTLEGKKVQFQLQKPFDTILNYNDNQLGLER